MAGSGSRLQTADCSKLPHTSTRYININNITTCCKSREIFRCLWHISKLKMSVRDEAMYTGKVMLAPMVRVCTLPMRLLALDYGADLVYCEEIVDRKILMCQKYDNELLGTTDFILSDGTVVFRTAPREKEKLIFQIGTCDAKRALAAAKKIQDFVAGVDINMGCPKEFSVKGGMGAALITQPEKVREILTLLVKELSVPVTCKIRCLPSLEKTLELVKIIESTGVSAVGVHGRTKDERSRNPNRDEFIQAVAKAVKIPVIANGGSMDIKTLADMERFRERTGACSVMVARAAEWNCSVFRKQGPLSFLDVIKSYLRYAFQYDNNEMNTKYCVLQIIHDKMTELSEADKCLAAKSLEEFADIWDMRSEYIKILAQRKERQDELSQKHADPNHGVKRRKVEGGCVLIELPVRYDKRLYPSTMTPKQVLNDWCKKCHVRKPEYDTTERAEDRCFHSTVKVEGKLYTNPYWEKSKQLAEQGAAISCLVVLGESDGRLAEPQNESEDLRRKWRTVIAEGGGGDSEQEVGDVGGQVSVTDKGQGDMSGAVVNGSTE
ncbi:tRNA-dihydrouridine(20) synthase [NAD(P)+]-like [Aplysia californica]|uniref:tRNA-dihydrouridine(20) synthase [NAD(P)+]-like n=1 Tax=Aplysia californica TaxID=6500 RepID=A0ABM0JXD7_APLCA|nr:tRNA-dihydrouridine(20) synthase [NAD(P)+]-like [Aplysia californica]